MSKPWIIVVVLVVAAALFWWMKGSAPSTSDSLSGASSSPVASVAGGSTVKKPAATATPVAPTQSYTQLVAQYKDRRIQFDSSCRATPTSFVLKNGSSILLDNRANVGRTVSVDGKSYSLGAYGYQVVTLSSATLPRTLKVSCGSSVNVSTILLQAEISGE